MRSSLPLLSSAVLWATRQYLTANSRITPRTSTPPRIFVWRTSTFWSRRTTRASTPAACFSAARPSLAGYLRWWLIKCWWIRGTQAPSKTPLNILCWSTSLCATTSASTLSVNSTHMHKVAIIWDTVTVTCSYILQAAGSVETAGSGLRSSGTARTQRNRRPAILKFSTSITYSTTDSSFWDNSEPVQSRLNDCHRVCNTRPLVSHHLFPHTYMWTRASLRLTQYEQYLVIGRPRGGFGGVWSCYKDGRHLLIYSELSTSDKGCSLFLQMGNTSDRKGAIQNLSRQVYTLLKMLGMTIQFFYKQLEN